MPSLNLATDFFSRLSVTRLMARHTEMAVLGFLRLMAHCGQHHEVDGMMADYTINEIEEIAGWKGGEGQLVNALVELKFLGPLPAGGWEIVGWREEQRHFAAYKEKSRKMVEARLKRAMSVDLTVHCCKGCAVAPATDKA